jgi:hypothetical protein
MSISMIGLDTAKSVFQILGVNGTGKVEIKRKLRRSELIGSVSLRATVIDRLGLVWV